MRTLSPIGMTLSSRNHVAYGAATGLHRSAMAKHDFDGRDSEEEATVLRTLPPELRPIPRPPELDTTQSRAARRARQRAVVSGESALNQELAPSMSLPPRPAPPEPVPLSRALRPPAPAFSSADTLYDEEDLTGLRPQLGDTLRAGLIGAGLATLGLLGLLMWAG